MKMYICLRGTKNVLALIFKVAQSKIFNIKKCNNFALIKSLSIITQN